MPDYSSSEKIITNSKNATYTISADGWISYKLQARWDPITIKINATDIGTTQVTTNDYRTVLQAIAPVKKGDIVKIWTASVIDDCYANVWFLSNR